MSERPNWKPLVKAPTAPLCDDCQERAATHPFEVIWSSNGLGLGFFDLCEPCYEERHRGWHDEPSDVTDLVQRLRKDCGIGVSHPHFANIASDLIEAADLLEAQAKRIAELEQQVRVLE